MSCFSNLKLPPRIDEDTGMVYCGGVRNGERCECAIGQRESRGRVALYAQHVYRLHPDESLSFDGEFTIGAQLAVHPYITSTERSFQMETILTLIAREGCLRVRLRGEKSPPTMVRVLHCGKTNKLVTAQEQPTAALVRMADNVYYAGMEHKMTAKLPLAELLDVLSAMSASLVQGSNAFKFLIAAEVAYFRKHGCPGPEVTSGCG